MDEIIISVIDIAGRPPKQTMSATFSHKGGSIGRDQDHATLHLPDPDKKISRIHAEIVWRSNGFFIVSRSPNPTAINGAELVPGEEFPLHASDVLEIGEYRMSVESTAAEAYRAAGVAMPATPDDPLGLGLAPPRPTADERYAPPGPGAILPTDFDPFRDLGGPARGSPPPVAPMSERRPPLAPASPADSLFAGLENLGSSGARSPFADLDAPKGPQPRDLFGQGNPLFDPEPDAQDRARSPLSDGVSPLAEPFVSRDRGAKQDAAAPARGDMPPGPGGGAAEFQFSWPETKPGPAAGRQEPGSTPRGDAKPPAVPPLQASPQGIAQRGADAHDPLLAAFLAGLNSPELKLEGLTPETMTLVGSLLRELLDGTLGLLRARAAIKAQIKADATMMFGTRNNPLKFTPDAESAARILLEPQRRGFLPPVEAVQEAFEDLREHEFGMLAGVRAALERLLQRFDPKNLEARIEKHSMLADLLPGARKSRLWDAFAGLHRELSQEALEDFQVLFGKPFLSAYKDDTGKSDKDDGGNRR